MNSRFAHCMIALLAMSTAWRSLAAEEDGVRTEIYSKRTDERTRIVVHRSEVRVSPELRAVLNVPREIPEPVRAYTVKVKLHVADTSPILLGSTLQWETEPPDRGFTVLDIIRDEGALILPVTVGWRLGLWRIEFEPVAHDSWAWLERWQVSALATPLDKRVRVKMSKVGDGRWVAEVTDLRTGGNPLRPPSRYEQAEAAWRFRLVRRWDEHSE